MTYFNLKSEYLGNDFQLKKMVGVEGVVIGIERVIGTSQKKFDGWRILGEFKVIFVFLYKII